MAKKKVLKCSFCGETSDKRHAMIVHPKVKICDECVEMCVELLLKKGTWSMQVLIKTPKDLMVFDGPANVFTVSEPPLAEKSCDMQKNQIKGE